MPTPEQPTRIGKYTILGRIGQGAMGQVFRALDPVLNRHVAIKMMTADVSADPQLSQRFLREAQSAARLNHPNVVTLHDFGEDQGQFFMAMELLEGQDLSVVIKQHKLATLEEKLALMEQVCDGLAYAHSMQVVHRDLKPANIHVQTSGRVKIMDFGLARLAGSDMTRAGTIMGSPNYMSPEQVRGERADARSDIFALGAVFYEVLAGRRAFDAEAMHAILYKVANVEPDSLARLVPDVPKVLAELVEKALQKEPQKRFSDAVEMREVLDVCRRVLEGSLDEDSGLASLREARTILEVAPSAPAELDPAGASTLSSMAATRPAISRRGTTGSIPVVRLGQSGSLPVVAPDAKTAVRPASKPTASLESQAAPAPSVAAGSRAPFYLAGGMSLAAIGAAVFFAMRPGPVAPPPASDARATALVAVAVESQLDVARKSLEYKDLQGAINAAEKALRLDAASVEAKAIQERAKAALDAVEAAARDAREAARAGDAEKATQALSRVLAQMPGHPVAAELAPQLNARFQTRAQEAQRQMKSSADAAQRAGASSLREYADGARLARQVEDLLRQQQYTEATQKALEGKKAYDLARAAAAELAAKPSAAPPSTVGPAAAATPPPAAPVVAAPATVAPVTAAPPAAVPVPTLATGPSDEALVRRVLSDFKRAIESKDVALYKSVRPGLSVDEEKKLRAAFASVRAQEVDLSIESVSIDGPQAVIRVVRSGMVNGQPVPTQKQVFRLSKGPSGWVIRDIGQ